MQEFRGTGEVSTTDRRHPDSRTSISVAICFSLLSQHANLIVTHSKGTTIIVASFAWVLLI